jgi:hypothetical protein
MRILFCTVSLACSAVIAQPVAPEDVAAECVKQMAMGICTTKPDRSAVARGQTMLISGVGRVAYSAYLDYMDLYNSKNPSDPAMCKLALRYMVTQPGGDHDKIARALWTPHLSISADGRHINLAEISIKAMLAVITTLVASILASRVLHIFGRN